jgi:hypothetical protein
MTFANVTMLIVLGLAEPKGDASALVAQLGSARYAEREAAALALEKLGRDALPALRAALDSRDLEVRTRSANLLEKIDSDLLTRPTMITLDFDNRPLDEVAKSIGDQYGIALVLQPENDPSWKTRKVTLKEAEPVPFWKAIDRLCQAGGLQYNAGSMGMMLGRGPVFHLFSGISQDVPTYDSGPFRVSLISVHHHRDLTLGQNAMGSGMRVPGILIPGRPLQPPVAGGGGAELRPAPAGRPDVAAARVANDQFFVQMMVTAEPRLIVSQSQELKLIEATDDLGHSLVRPSAGQAQRTSAYYGYSMSAMVQMPIHLVYPEQQPGQKIKILRGTLPVSLSARKADPLVVPLKNEVVGKAFKGSDVSVTVNEIKSEPNAQRTTIDITLRALNSPEDAGAAQGVDMMRTGFRAPNLFQNQLEILDDQGKVLHALPSTPANGRPQADEMRFTITLTPLPGVGAPSQLRYYSLSHATAEVAFEFHDIPMP